MSIDVAAIKKQAAAFKFSKETSTAFHESLFTLHPEIAEKWDAEDIAPEKLCKSQKFMMMGMEEMRQMIGLVNNYGGVSAPNDCGMCVQSSWKAVLSSMCEYYAENNVSLVDESIWACLCDGVTGALAKHGGCSPADKSTWEALFKAAYADAKTGKYI